MSTALLTDRYELTMLQAALESGRANRRCVFEVFSRQLPSGRRYGVLAGTGRVLDAIKDFRFQESEIAWLAEQKVVNSETLDWLAKYKFSGDIRGYAEGEIYFGKSPVLTVEGSFAEAVLLETVILSILNFDSAVASAAARMHSVAQGRRLVEMGGRRAHELAAVAAARAAYIAGFDSTSNLEAGRLWGIPTMGTSAHSFTLLHDSEREAFKAQLDSMGNDTTLLVDTFNVDEAVKTAVELAGPNLGAVRIDSGDLTENAKRVRELLDSLGATKTKITVTSDLDEYAIAALAAAPVDGYGVGTSLVTGSGSPTAGFVYKLVSHTDGGEWVDVAKTSTAKTNRGGEKFAYRKLTDGKATAEVIAMTPNGELGRELQVQLVTDGKIHQEYVGPAGVLKARNHHSEVRKELPESALRLSKGEGALGATVA